MAECEEEVIVVQDDEDEVDSDVECVSVSPPALLPTASTSTMVQQNQPPQQPNKTEKETMECPICLQTCIHPARLPCGHIFCFLCVKGVAYKNRRCAMCRREIPPEFLDHPQLVHGIQELCKSKSTEDGYQWFYEGRNGWWQYDERTSQDIEEAYKKGEKSCTILVAGYVYVVDFEGMMQKRQTDPSRVRHVKRDLATIPKKGVAGLRIEGNTVATDSDFAAQVYQSQRSPAQSSTSTQETTTHPRSNFISTIAATDAAIRIASDIIGSTLAHADEISRSDRRDQRSAGSSSSLGTRDILAEAEELLDNTQRPGISAADQHTLDLFEQTLDDFRSLTLRNIIDLSDSEGDDLIL